MAEFRPEAPSAPAVFYRSYSRRKADDSRESYVEAIQRTITDIARIGRFNDEQYNLCLEGALNQNVFPSGRSLWVAGTEWSKKPDNFPGFYNCCSMHVDEVEIFGLLMELAMMGTGTGAVLEDDVIAKLPSVLMELSLKDVIPVGDRGGAADTSLLGNPFDNLPLTIRVGDSRQGWADAYMQLIKLSMGMCTYSSDGKREIVLDLSQVRPAGKLLKGFGGKANPVRLEETFRRVIHILADVANREVKKLTPIDACLIIDEAASAVVAGNIRRCLPFDALVHTDRGLVPIENVNIGDYVETPIGMRRITNKFDQGVQDVIKSSTNSMPMRATGNHRVAVLKDAKGGYEWKHVKDLQAEDRLLHNTRILPGGLTRLPADDTASRPKNSRTAKDICIPALNTDIAWLIGYTHGNGYIALGRNKYNKPYGKIEWAMNNLEVDLRDELRARIENAVGLFGLDVRHWEVKGENTAKVTCSSIRLAEYFHKHIKQAKKSIVIPDFILEGPVDVRAAYLAGLIDSDGSASHRPPILVTTIYPELARQAGAVLSSLGIPGRFHTKKRKQEGWATIYNVSIPAFKHRYNGIIAPYSAKGSLQIGLKHNGFTIPGEIMRQAFTDKQMREMGYSGAVAVASNVERFIDEIGHDTDIPVTYRGIDSIDSVQTYDIEVEEAHCFYCDGYLTHNSAGIRQGSSDNHAFAVAKDGLYHQDEDGNWSVDPNKEALRMANHTRCFHHKPTRQEIHEAVTKQFYSGEGAIMYVPEAIARANADLLDTPQKRSEFLKCYSTNGRKAAEEYLTAISRFAGYPDNKDIMTHRMDRYGLNPCAEVIMRDNLCNLSEIHLNTLDPKDDEKQYDAFYAGGLQVAALLQHQFVPKRLQYSREVDPIVGVSFTGLFDFFVHAFGADWLQWMMQGRPEDSRAGKYFPKAEREFLARWREAAEWGVIDYCNQHKLRRPNRFTTVQPAGSKSLLTGASAGWHPPKSQRFIRRITFGVDDPLVSALRDWGYNVIPAQSARDELGNLLDDISDPRVHEVLVEIPTEVSWANLPGCDQFDLSKLPIEGQWGLYMQVQKYYTTHNTSATLEFREEEIDTLSDLISDAISKDDGYISAALLARFDANETFPRLPFEPISKEKYELLMIGVNTLREVVCKDKTFLDVLREYDDHNYELKGAAGCDSDKCLMEDKPRT